VATMYQVGLEPDSKITFLDLRPWRGVA